MPDISDKDSKVNGTVRYTKTGQCPLQRNQKKCQNLYENHMME